MLPVRHTHPALGHLQKVRSLQLLVIYYEILHVGEKNTINMSLKPLIRRLLCITSLPSVSVSLFWQVVGLHEVRVAQAGLGGRARSCCHAAGRCGCSLAAGGPRAHSASEPAAGVCRGVD